MGQSYGIKKKDKCKKVIDYGTIPKRKKRN